jgi:hypothetical protein
MLLTYLRYFLATLCFAASVGCLALWKCGDLHYRELQLPSLPNGTNLSANTFDGTVNMFVRRGTAVWRYQAGPITTKYVIDLREPMEGRTFGTKIGDGWLWAFFPLWYASLIFALAGVASLRFGRRFTLRSAIIATTVVAGLLGMAVIL